MKKNFPGRIHTSILSHVFSVALLCTTYYVLCTTPAHAACIPGACSGTGSPCSVSAPIAGASSTQYCCTGTNAAAECTALKTSQATSTTSQKVVGAGAGATAKTDPTDGCSDTEINTALGCISVETKGFSAALLRFLAGTSGGISLVIMLIATIQIMTGGDNAEQVKKGKELFTGAVTGLLFIIFSVAILRIIAGDIIKLEGFK